MSSCFRSFFSCLSRSFFVISSNVIGSPLENRTLSEEASPKLWGVPSFCLFVFVLVFVFVFGIGENTCKFEDERYALVCQVPSLCSPSFDTWPDGFGTKPLFARSNHLCSTNVLMVTTKMVGKWKSHRYSRLFQLQLHRNLLPHEHVRVMARLQKSLHHQHQHQH